MKVRVSIVLLLSVVGLSARSNKAVERCNVAAQVLNEIMEAEDSSIPLDLLSKAQCVAIIPGVTRVGFSFGGKYGKGVLVCRGKDNKSWTGPSTVRIEGGSWGLQIGASSTDLMLLVMNQRGAEKLVRSKFMIGGDASVAAGPVGRAITAQTDAQLHAEILSYSRSRGLFAGISLEGATLRPDHAANLKIYGKAVQPKHILGSSVPAPESTKTLVETLSKYSYLKH